MAGLSTFRHCWLTKSADHGCNIAVSVLRLAGHRNVAAALCDFVQYVTRLSALLKST
jgi:hypothetical protein